jgi:hypothetical protein
MRVLCLACACVLLWVGGAQAKREQSFRYPYSRVWSSTLRMLRVDFQSPIQEKDQESGYFLFDFPESGKSHPGSVELVRSTEGGVETVRVMITISALPTYVEQMLLDRLQRKLSQEFGDPTEPAKQPAKPPAGAPGKGEGAAKPEPTPGTKPKPAPQP